MALRCAAFPGCVNGGGGRGGVLALYCGGVVVRSDAGVVGFGVGACVLVVPGVVVLCGDGRVVDVTWYVVRAMI